VFGLWFLFVDVSWATTWGWSDSCDCGQQSVTVLDAVNEYLVQYCLISGLPGARSEILGPKVYKISW